MSKAKDKKIIYYKDEQNDDFAGTNITTCCVDGSFKYIHKNIFWRFISFLLYYFVAVPLVFVYMRVILRVRFVNKKAIKKCKGQPYFLYGNHTGFYDAFTPNLISFPRRNRILVNPDTVSIKGLKSIVQMFGALPIPSDFSGMRGFLGAVDYYSRHSNITVYPEAHIWHYFNGVRCFSDVSFAYPAKSGAPTFAFFTAYTKPKGLFSFRRKANMTVYSSDPIYAEGGLTPREKRQSIRNQVYSFMLEKSRLSDYEVIKYVKVSDENK